VVPGPTSPKEPWRRRRFRPLVQSPAGSSCNQAIAGPGLVVFSCAQSRASASLSARTERTARWTRRCEVPAFSVQQASAAVYHRYACSGVKALRNTSAARRQENPRRAQHGMTESRAPHKSANRPVLPGSSCSKHPFRLDPRPTRCEDITERRFQSLETPLSLPIPTLQDTTPMVRFGRKHSRLYSA
jgi:hypothetical protein